jgi:hypothetical protein
MADRANSSKICSVEGCGRPAKSRGLCSAHYERQRLHGATGGLPIERRAWHGLHGCPEYRVYHSMIARCHRPTDKHYASYGGRGIAVCERWRASFEAFIEDMGRRPSAAHSIDRIDNDGDYSPGNCRWVERAVQQQNRRPVKLSPELVLEARAVRSAGGNVAKWAREHGVSKDAALHAASGKSWKNI